MKKVKTNVSRVLVGICCFALSGTMLSVSEKVYADEIVGIVSDADTVIVPRNTYEDNSTLGVPVPTLIVDDDGVLLDCVSKDIEAVHLDNTIKAINDKAFAGCTNLKEITMTNSVEIIGDRAFDACPNLENVVLSGRAVTYDNIFGYMHDGFDYKGINLSFADDGLNKSAKGEDENNILVAEIHSEQIKSVTVPDGYYALDLDLSGCLNLESVAMTNSVHFIKENAFNACPNLENVVLSGHVLCEKLFGNMHDGLDYKGINLSFADDGLNKSAKGEDENNILVAEIHSEQIKSVTVPDGYYFLDLDLSGCLNLESVAMTNSVHHIIDNAFNACSNIKTVKISSEIVDLVTKENMLASSENFVKISYDGMISGDANNDGAVSMADAVCLMKILTCQNTEYPTMASDTNEDGKINILDLIHLKNMLLS